MRHRIAGRKFSRSTKQRKALFFSGLQVLIENGFLKTTLERAKSIRRIAEKLITKARQGDVASRRKIHLILRKRSLVNKLVDEIAPLFRERKGGYLRIIRFPPRQGDKAVMARLEFVEYPQKMNEVDIKDKKETKKIKNENKDKSNKKK